MLYRFRFAGLLLLFAVPLFAGCDLTGDDSVDALVDEADMLIQSNPAKAVRLLEEALAAEPENKRVKATLAIALVEANDITIFDVQRVFDALTDGGAPLSKRQRPADTCAPAGVDQAGQTFDPTIVEGLSDVLAAYPVLTRIHSLLADVLPADLSGLTLADVQAHLAEAGIGTSKASAVLLASALADALSAYTDVFFENTGTAAAPAFSLDPDVTFYRVAGPPTYYGFCVTDAKYASVCADARAGIASLTAAVDALQARAVDGAEDTLVQEARAALASLSNELADC